ncbi:MAG: GTPase HflX, partial [Comamonadaceae bacterium]|nr:GTPase HflX [Comamonadaceae bacterium]
ATLQEAVDAGLLLHVVDASNETFPEQMDQVRKVLGEIGALDIPQILVFNKLDALPDGRKPVQLQDTYDVDGVAVPRVFVSARSGEGLTQLRQMLADAVLSSKGAADASQEDESLQLPPISPEEDDD